MPITIDRILYYTVEETAEITGNTIASIIDAIPSMINVRKLPVSPAGDMAWYISETNIKTIQQKKRLPTPMQPKKLIIPEKSVKLCISLITQSQRDINKRLDKISKVLNIDKKIVVLSAIKQFCDSIEPQLEKIKTLENERKKILDKIKL
jgi:hypothetical protein